jgi:predicted aspartyl protease
MKGPLLSRCLLVMILILLCADLSWSQATIAPVDPAGQETLSFVHTPTKHPFHLCWGYLVIVEGNVGNFQKLNFLVDTGAYPSIIDRRIADKLGLAEQPARARVNLSNQTVQTRTVILPSLTVGPIHIVSLPVLSQDLTFIQKDLGYRIDAIVGLDVLRKSSFTIDYKAKEMLFGTTENFTFSAPFETDSPIVTVRIESQHRQFRLVVDTGSPDLMLFRSRLADSIGFQPLGTEIAMDASGKFQRQKVRIPEVILGREKIGSQIAFVIDDSKDDGDDFDGVLGAKGAQFWKIAFDFEHRRLWWER